MKKKDFLNLISLTCIQVSNAFLPLIIFPYILKTVGSEFYSKITITEAISLIVLNFVIFSFEINGVSKVIGLDLEKDIKKLSSIFSNIFFTRVSIFILCLILIGLATPFFEKDFILLLFYWMLVPLSFIIQPLWLFQGLEKNVPPAIFTFISRLICILLITQLIKKPDNYILVPLIVGLSYIFGAVLSLVFVLVKLKIKLQIVTFSNIKCYLNNGKEIFLSNISVLLYRDFNVIILGFLHTNPISISIYSMAEKLIKALQATTRPLNQLFFPKVIYLLKNNSIPDTQLFKRIMKLVIPQLLILIGLTILLIIGYFYVKRYTSLLNNFPYKERITLLFLIMNIVVFFGILNFMLGIASLNYLNEKKYLFKIIFLVGIFNIIFCTILSFFWKEIGAAICFTLSEVFLFIFIAKKYTIFKLNKNRKNVFLKS